MKARTIPYLAGINALLILLLTAGCSPSLKNDGNVLLKNGEALLGNPDYPALSYSGHRKNDRTVANTPTLQETKEDLKILSAMGIRLIRMYNTQLFPHSERTLRAIRELQHENPDFEMYVMLGAWIQCQGAYTDHPDHSVEDSEQNRNEIEQAIRLTAEYPDIVKIIAVGNEAMVTWQAHFVPAAIILKWVNVLQDARTDGRIPSEILLTTSDNWAALGGETNYHNDDLAELLKKIDFLSLHTYAFHDSYYNPDLQWAALGDEAGLSIPARIEQSVNRSISLQKTQYQAVKDYLSSLGIEKEIHIGETGWASLDNAHYGPDGTGAAHEYTAKVFYDACMKWTGENQLTCFYFEAFDEPWKSKATEGSEGHFGLFTVDGQAKYALWNLVDRGLFKGLSRGGNLVAKTHGGDVDAVHIGLQAPVHLKFQP